MQEIVRRPFSIPLRWIFALSTQITPLGANVEIGAVSTTAEVQELYLYVTDPSALSVMYTSLVTPPLLPLISLPCAGDVVGA